GLAGIAKLKEEGDLDAGGVEAPARLADVLDAGALVHRVEDLLRPGFRADPDRSRPGAPKRRDGVALEQEGDPLQALEGDRNALALDQVGEALDPAGLEAQDVVDEPDVVRLVGLAQPGELLDDALRAADVVALAPDRLGAPVTVKRAAARRRHVHRVVA